MTPTSSQAMIANGLAGLNFPLSLTHFFNTELPPTHPLSGRGLSASTKQDDHPWTSVLPKF